MQLVSQLSRWCQVREDLMYAFEKSLETGIDEPMRQAVQSFLTRVHGGMPVNQALDLLQNHFAYGHFQDLIAALRFNFRYRGDLSGMLEHLEMQFYKIEEEATQRRISSFRDRKLSWFIVALGPIVTLLRLATDDATHGFFIETTPGRFLLILAFSLSLIAAFFLLLLQNRLTS